MNLQLTPKHSIGHGDPCFIIAEVGSNWSTFQDCIHSITMAKACGADAVKFQLYNHRALYGWDALPSGMAADGSFVFTEPAGSMPVEWLPKLKEHADAVGIEFMCSAFSPELVEAVNPYVNCHKVASAEISHVRLLEKLKQFSKPVILSTGASGDGDISMALEVLGATPCALLYCVAGYPSKSHRLEHIDLLRSRFNRLVGLSDHSLDVFTAPAEAIFQHRAAILEKHFNAIEGLRSPDSEHSLNVDEFKQMVQRCRNNVVIESRQTSEERGMYLKHNRRLIAIRDIQAGDTLSEGHNFGIFRSLKEDTRAFSPFLVNQVAGKTALKPIRAGDGIGPGDC